MRRQRSRIAYRPSSRFHQRDEPFHRFVEQGGLFEIEHVAGLRKHGEPRRRQMLLQEQACAHARIVLVAADDECRRRGASDRVRHRKDRGTAGLEAAHRPRRSLGVVPRQGGVEIGMTARVLHQEGNPARRLARDFCDFRGAERFELLRVGAALLAPGVEVLDLRA